MHSHDTDNRVVITLDNISMRWDNRQVLTDVNLNIHRHDFLAITGPNGGGKSTLLRIILKLLKPSAGFVTYYDNDGNSTNHLKIGYLPQKNMIDSRFPITVREVIESGLAGCEKCVDSDARVKETLDTIELAERADHSIGQLSGGQLQRVLLGRAIISNPNILVLDEPLSYLDKHFEEHTYNLLQTMAHDTTIILVSHEMTTIAGMASRHFIVDNHVHECAAHHHFIHTDCK